MVERGHRRPKYVSRRMTISHLSMRIVPVIFARLSRHRRKVLVFYGLAVAVSAWLCTLLHLDTDLLNLLPEDIPSVRSARKLQSWSGELGHMYLGLVRDKHTSAKELKDFADAIGKELEKSQWIKPEIAVGVDVTKIKRAVPLFLDGEDLETVGERLEAVIRAERRRLSGFFLDLEDEEDEEESLGLSDLLPKYERRFQMTAAKSNGQNTAMALVDQMRAKLNEDGTRLYYISDDTKMLAFPFHPIFPPLDLTHYPALVQDVDAAVAAARAAIPNARHVEVYSGGAYPLQWDQRDATLRDSMRSTFFAGLLILLVVGVTVRRLRAVVLVFLALMSGLVITFGLAYLVIGAVNVITAFLLAILAGLGIDFGLYFATRCLRFARAGLALEDAIEEAWTQTAVPAFMGALTTFAVMLLLTLGEFRAFAELGIICSIGITAIYGTMYTLLPVLFLELKPFRLTADPDAPGLDRVRRTVAAASSMRSSERWERFSPGGSRARAVLVAGLLITALAAWSAQDVRFAYTGEELTVEGQRSLEVDRRILEHFGENVDQTVVLAKTEQQGRRIHQFFRDHFGTFSTISRYESAFTYAPPLAHQQEAAKHLGPLREAVALLPGRSSDPGRDFLYKQAREMIEATPIPIEDLPEHIKTFYLGRNRQNEIVGYLGHITAKEWLWEVDELTRFVNEIEAIRVDGKPIESTGRPQIFLQVIRIVQHEAKRFFLWGLLLILVMLWLQARRLRFALLAMIPLVLGLVWTLGVLPHVGDQGLSLSFMNLMVLPLFVGLGVSYGVHIVYSYRLYGSADRALRVVARPVLGSSLTTLAGWSSLLLASMIGMRGMGWLASLAMVSVTLTSLLVLPAIIALLDRLRWIRADRRLGT